MKKSGTRIRADISRIHSDNFTEICRNGKSNVFVRNRKMPLDDPAFSMINRKGLTLKLELRGYMNISHPGIQISKPGYLKQLMKLKKTKLLLTPQMKKLYHKQVKRRTRQESSDCYWLQLVHYSDLQVAENVRTNKK